MEPEVLNSPKTPSEGWLRSIRQSKSLSQRQVAEKVGVSQQAFDQFERGEVRGTITLETLRGAAEAMDADLVYFLRPRGAIQAPVRKVRREPKKAPVAAAVDNGELPVALL